MKKSRTLGNEKLIFKLIKSKDMRKKERSGSREGQIQHKERRMKKK